MEDDFVNIFDNNNIQCFGMDFEFVYFLKWWRIDDGYMEVFFEVVFLYSEYM